MTIKSQATEGGSRKHKAFRLLPDSARKLKETAELFGRSETSTLEMMIDSFYEGRAKHFENYAANRLKGVK